MKQDAANSVAYWLLKTHPELFASLLHSVQGMSGLGQDVTLSDIGTSDIVAASSTLPDITTDTSSPGFFSSLASGIGNAVQSVGSALTNPSVLNSFANAASNYFKAQGTSAQAKAQTAVLSTQLARAQSGLPAAPVTYTTNPITGQLTPVYVPSPAQPIPGAVAASPFYGSPTSGSPFGYAVTPGNIGALAPNFFQQYGLWLAIGGVLLVGAILLSRR
jgi:hypothetical protein